MTDNEEVDETTGHLGRRQIIQLSSGTALGGLLIDDVVGEARAAMDKVTIDGPREPTVDTSNEYEAELQRPVAGARYVWMSSGDISGSGKSVQITFDSAGSHNVSVSVHEGSNTIGSEFITVDVQEEGSGPGDPVDVTIEGPPELVADSTYQFEAVPDEDDVEFEEHNWDVPSLSADEFDVIGSGRAVDIVIYPEGDYKVTFDYETIEGYSNSSYTNVDVLDLSRDKEKKQDLADEIERLAVALDEDDLTETLDSMIGRAEDGEVAPSTVREAIHRMRLAEDVTEKTLAGMGPKTADSPEQDLVGEPSSSVLTQAEYTNRADVNLTGETVESVAWLTAGMITGAKALTKLAKRLRSADEVSKSAEVLLDNVDALMSLFPSQITMYGKILDAANDLFGFIEEEEEQDADALINYLDEPVKLIRDEIGKFWQGLFETGGAVNSDFEDHLEELNDEVSGGGYGDIELQGTRQGAEAAAETGGKRTVDKVEGGLDAFVALDYLSEIGSWISFAAMVALAASSWTGVGAVLAGGIAAVGSFLTLSAEFLGMMNGSIQLWTLREIHQQSINRIIAGEDWA